ncbi:hypothetical protein [Paraburkholderia haematera]|uniref:hypothetical protein n=1 Tax=Paraburkholderia haematera TaxID=2793077 RepID=UPI001B8C5A93|nr:hypothetical protein [Paraburkholderia haematera]
MVNRTTAAGAAPTTPTNSAASSIGPAAPSAQPSNIYDLTPWLGEGSTIRVQKSTREPAGAFSISFADKLDGGLKDSLYTLIEPMDLIEIRFAGDAYQYTSAGQLPIMMRGFVSAPKRRQSMGSDGKPHRTVEVVGHDYGKILQLIQIFNLPTTPDAADLISSFPLFSKYGDALNVQDSTAFLLAVFNQIVNKYISTMQASQSTSAAPLLEIATDIQTPSALVSVQLGAFNNGTVQQLIQEYLDIGPFNEFFIEDRDAGAWGPAGPYAVYRPMPFLDAIARTPLQPIQDSVTTAVDPSGQLAPTANIVSITSDSIVSIEAERSDANVANYYWVEAPRFNMNYDDVSKMMANFSALQGSSPYYVTDHGNINPQLYGIRKLEVATQQGGSAETNSGNGTAAGATRFANQQSFLDWITARRNTLILLNRDNVVLEHGSMHLKGDERIRAGVYVKVRYGATPNNPQGSIQSLYYAHSVTHVYEVYGSYFVEVEFDRGTNFVDRITQAQGGVPAYYADKVSWSQQ